MELTLRLTLSATLANKHRVKIVLKADGILRKAANL
jgi:hypothetical protein